MSGTISKTLSNSAIQFLQLGGNNFTGSLPPLPSAMQYINVSASWLTGPLPALPDGIWQADFGYNSLTGSLPDLAAHDYLEVFDVSANQLKGTIPGECSKQQPNCTDIQNRGNVRHGGLFCRVTQCLVPLFQTDLFAS